MLHPKSYADSLALLGAVLLSLRNYNKSEEMLRRAAYAYQGFSRNTYDGVPLLLRANLGNVLKARNKLNEAEGVFREILAENEQLGPTKIVMMAYTGLANIFRAQARYLEAEKLHRLVLDAYAKTPGLNRSIANVI